MKHKLTVLGLSFLLMAVSAAADGRRETPGSQSLDRGAITQEILGLWGSAPNPVVGENLVRYGDIHAALKAATMDQLLEARAARTYEDFWTALSKGARSPLAAGRTPLALGEDTADLVFTAVTPCRIIDTRAGVSPYTGILAANTGRGFLVVASDYSVQGGFAGSCGIPSNPPPAAIAINLTSTGQSGPGNLRVIQSGGGVPNASLLNYVAGVNTANAATVPSFRNNGYDIYIWSANSASHAIVDIMGYYTSPKAAQELLVESAPGALAFGTVQRVCATGGFTPTQSWMAYPVGTVSILADSAGLSRSRATRFTARTEEAPGTTSPPTTSCVAGRPRARGEARRQIWPRQWA